MAQEIERLFPRPGTDGNDIKDLTSRSSIKNQCHTQDVYADVKDDGCCTNMIGLAYVRWTYIRVSSADVRIPV